MKFGNLLRSTSIELPEVTCLFNTYKQLKKQLKRLPDRDQVSAAVGDAQQQQALTQDEAQFVATIDNNLANLNNMFLEREEEAVIRLERLQQATAAAADDERRRTVYKQLVDFHGEVLLLVHWSVLAYTATVKILKKHHKRTGLLLRAPQLENLLSQPFCSTEVMSQLARKAEACVQELAAALAGTTPVPASSADVSGGAAAHAAAGAAEAGAAGPSAPVQQTDAAHGRPGSQSAAPAGPSDMDGAAAGAAAEAAAASAQVRGGAAHAQQAHLARSSSRTDLGWQAQGSTLGLAEAQGEVEGDAPAGDSPAGGSPAGHSPAGGSPAGGDVMEGLQGWSPAESGSGAVVGPAVWGSRPASLPKQAGPGAVHAGMDAAAPPQQQEAQAGPSHPPQQPPHQGTLISSTTSTSSTELSSVCREGSDVEDAGLAGLHQLLAAHPAWGLRAGASQPEAQDAATSAPTLQQQQQQQRPTAGAAAATSSAAAPAAAEAGAAGAVACSEEHSGVVGGGSPRSRGHGHAQAPPHHHHRHLASVLRRTQLALDTWLQLRTNAHSPSTVLPPQVTTGGAAGAGAGPSRLAGVTAPVAGVPACSDAAVAGAAGLQVEGAQGAAQAGPGTAVPASHQGVVPPSGEQLQGTLGSKRAREETEGEGDAANVVQHLQKRQA